MYLLPLSVFRIVYLKSLSVSKVKDIKRGILKGFNLDFLTTMLIIVLFPCIPFVFILGNLVHTVYLISGGMVFLDDM